VFSLSWSSRAYFLLKQIEAPWQPIDGEGRATNLVLEWRLLPPLLAHYLSLPNWVFLSLPFLGCFATAAYVFELLYRRVARPGLVVAGTAIVCASAWLFVSTSWLGYFDAWLIFCLLCASFSPSRRVVLAVSLLAPWIDERFILALPIAAAARCLWVEQPSEASEAGSWRQWLGAVLGGIAPYGAIRLIAEVAGFRHTTSQYDLSQYAASLWQVGPLMVLKAFMHGLRFGGPFAVYVGWCLVRQYRNSWRWLLALGVVVSSVVSLVVAADLSRSLAVLCPLVVCGYALACRRWEHWLGYLAPALAIATLLLPGRHIVTTFERPIQNIVEEVRLWQTRRTLITPEHYNKLGLAALRQNQTQEAETYFDSAILVDDRYAVAYGNKGAMLHLAGRTKDALPLLDQALALDPALLDVRLNRARVRLGLGLTAGAREDLHELLRRAPANWPRRADGEQLLASVDAQLAR
jgi:tetratricopeptide (TPR) repeat protein